MPDAALRNRIVGSGEEAPDQLVANPRNWRIHPRTQQMALRGSLETVGWVQQVLVNRRTGNLVDGHARVEEALSRGEAMVPVLYVDLAPEEEALVLATLDPIAAMAGTDDTKLRELLAELTVEDAGLAAMLGELAPLEPRAGLTDPDDVPDLGEKSNIQSGDLFAVGNHRLMCGDSTNAVDVGRLTGDAIADIIVTDPPYGVAYQRVLGSHGSVGSPEYDTFLVKRAQQAKRLHRRKDLENLTVENDDLGFEGTKALVQDAMTNAPLRPGGAFYLFAPPGDMELAFRLALIDADLPMRHAIVWVKDRFAFGRSDYHYRHESLLYGWRSGAAHFFVDDRTQDSVWECPQPRSSEDHPTMKPVELVVRALANSSKAGDLVYEPFSGSGTTLIAAEQIGRRCYAMEIDPRYVAVAIARWEKFTGQKAVKL